MKAVVDRFEGDIAVILLGDEEIRLDLPRRYLPGQVAEGSILRLRWEVDEDTTTTVREQMRQRIERLKRGGTR